MSSKYINANIKIENLKLDLKNPRFSELYSGSDKEEELIEYLLYNESAEDIAIGILKNEEFYSDRPLWVLKDGNDFIVKDGNRRCSAVKALQFPQKFGLDLEKMVFEELPVLIYNNKSDLDLRIFQEHTNSLFKEWDRISKALETFKLFNNGSSVESMKDIDSQPAQLIKLASFYYEAVAIGGEDLKKLLRRGRGKTGGKTIIFERLFKLSEKCGFSFFNKPSYKIKIKDQKVFESYIKAMIKYLIKFPETKTQDIDKKEDDFLTKLIPFGFVIKKDVKVEIEKENEFSSNPFSNTETENYSENTKQGSERNSEENERYSNNRNTNSDYNNQTNSNDGKSSDFTTEKPVEKDKRKSIKDKPIYKRKKIPAPLERLIRECYALDAVLAPNSKTALTRVTFECALKYVVENTIYINNKKIYESNYFRNVYYENNNVKKTYADFTKLKILFTLLITNTGVKKAFESFELEKPHQIIHNYHVGAIPSDARGLCENLISLLEFLLQEESDLISSIDVSKLN